MYLCYIDESGTPELPGTSTHFVLCGFSIPVSRWRECDNDISVAMARHGLENQELHTAWLLRNYLEQSKIPKFAEMDWISRRSAVERYRTGELLRLQKLPNIKPYRQAKKNYSKTGAYVHLTRDERNAAVKDVADVIASWGEARLFAECIDKTHHDAVLTGRTIAEQGFEQVVSRFQQYLSRVNRKQQNFGLLIHDNNQTVAKKHTDMMRTFHKSGTLWTSIGSIIETPLFVDSQLTRMVQIADLCSYALRRFVENGDVDLFQRIFQRADAINGVTVGVRHYAGMTCRCNICTAHRPAPPPPKSKPARARPVAPASAKGGTGA